MCSDFSMKNVAPSPTPGKAWRAPVCPCPQVTPVSELHRGLGRTCKVGPSPGQVDGPSDETARP